MRLSAHVVNVARLRPLNQAYELRLAVLVCFTTLIAPPAHAALLRGCQPSDSVLLCRLESVLTGLETLAGILAFLLIVAILLAVRAYRRKPRKLTPDDITPDAR